MTDAKDRVFLKARRRKTSSNESGSPEKVLYDVKYEENGDIPEINESEELEEKDLIKRMRLELKRAGENSKKNENEIDELKQTVHVLYKSLEESKQWQSTVYAQMQQMTEFNNQMSQRLNELNVEIKTLKHDNDEFKPKDAPSESVTKMKEAVVYGDSTSAKKLSTRRKLTKTHQIPKTDIVQKPNGKSSNKESSNICKQKRTDIEKIVKEEKKETDNSTVSENGKVEKLNTEREKVVEPPNLKEEDDTTEEGGTLNIEEELRNAAEEAMSKSGFAYDESSGMYYNWESGMYYDPNSQLYYDHKNGVYYYYDQEKETYIFHSQIKVAEEKTDESDSNDQKDGQLSDGEIRSEPVSPAGPTPVIDPCIRAMIVKSESVDVGSLYIVTCQGGSIGKDPSNTICLADDELASRSHAKILYENESKTFFIQDLKTQNGTYINDERIADARCESEPIEVTHRDFIRIGETTISFHVHTGNETCFDCEPGNIQAILEAEKEKATREDLNKQRKHEVKSMMKKYGLSKGYIPKKLIESVPDRAARRRKEVGSDPYENILRPVEKASVHKEISDENIGHKMLAKMGWKSGEGLGKSQQGIAEPIGVQVHGKNKGLGFGSTAPIDSKPSRKQDILNKTKERFEKISK
ncbi:angiogenic factor with G patch and FHA domains 1-like [Clytia hemisphaerica]